MKPKHILLTDLPTTKSLVKATVLAMGIAAAMSLEVLPVPFVGRVPAALKADPLRMAAQILLVAILLFLRPAMRRRIADDAYLLGRIRTDRFTHTVRTTVLTALHLHRSS